MPTYEYMCKKCGPFTQMRAMAECELPSACPECGARAPRAFLTAPACMSMSAEARQAGAKYERSILARSCWNDPEVETCPEVETYPGESVSARLTDLASRDPANFPHGGPHAAKPQRRSRRRTNDWLQPKRPSLGDKQK